MMRIPSFLLFFILVACLATTATGQENVAPIRYNPALERQPVQKRNLAKTTALTLPFFEDFTDYDLFPSQTRWVERQVYVNNTMGQNPISRGVATFDALNQFGRPYDTVNAFSLFYADSLTSQPFDLSTYVPGDSLYLSFFYQPQGNGFSPEATDSFMLYFRTKNGVWQKQWAVPGTTVQPFTQAMAKVADTNFLYDAFQFRFVNKASVNLNDDVWNLDYIRLAANRSFADTAITDIAFSADPTFLLNDYTSLPYRQFVPNAAGERAAQHTAYVHNSNGTNQNVSTGFTARETTTGTALGSATGTAASVAPYSNQSVVFTTYTNAPAAPGINARMVFENKYYLQSGASTGSTVNDTIVKNQVFDNYLAYDDGTAEKSYFLNLFASLPGIVAIEHRLNAPDTLRGLAILFGQQVTTSAGKFFSVLVYRTLAGINGGTTNNIVYQQDFLQPRFIDTVNRFYIYGFDSPVPMPAGTFYFGVMQPASSGSDSLYYALDANRITGNHLYYNVLNIWQSSGISGALMIRPLLGGRIQPSAVPSREFPQLSWSIYPNPGTESVKFRADGYGTTSYQFTDMQGRNVLNGNLPADQRVDASRLVPGLYLVRLQRDGVWTPPQRWVKL